MAKQTHPFYGSRNKKVEQHSTNFGARLRGLIDQKRLPLVEFARQYGITESHLHLWLKRSEPPISKHWSKLAKFFGVSEQYVATGAPIKKEPRQLPPSDVAPEHSLENEPRFQEMRMVPIVSWAHAGAAAVYDEIPAYEQDRVASGSTDPQAFAVVVEGDSMLPDFKPGDRLILAPSRVPRSGHPVVAKLADDGIVLRIYHKLSPVVIRLSSLRPEIYPAMDYAPQDLQWIWPVEELNRRAW